MTTAVFLALSAVGFFGVGRAASGATRQVTALKFQSHNKTIHADCYEPTATPPIGSVIVLHGAGGTFFDGPAMKRAATACTDRGLCAYVVHYFDGSGVRFTTSDRTLGEHYNEWLAVVQDAVTFAQDRQPDRTRPVFIYGYSMGAFLSLNAASDNPKVGAVAEQAGGVWDNKVERVGRMPPVLMIHGREDRRVTFDKYVPSLEKALRRRGGIVETFFVPGEGHSFKAEAEQQAHAKAADFFVRQSGGGKPGRRAGRGAIQSDTQRPQPSFR